MTEGWRKSGGNLPGRRAADAGLPADGVARAGGRMGGPGEDSCNLKWVIVLLCLQLRSAPATSMRRPSAT